MNDNVFLQSVLISYYQDHGRPLGFSYMRPLMCFSTSTRFTEPSQLAPIICAGWR